MAQIESTAIGEGRKSLGNITYRYVNGKTIASKRVTTNNSRTPLQVKQRQGFTGTVKLAKAINPLVYIGFEKGKAGSPNNQFVKHNGDYMNYIKVKSDYDVNRPQIAYLYEAINDSNFTGKVVIANGNLNLTNVFAFNSEDKLTCKMYLSRDFLAGDTITLAVCSTYMLVGSMFEAIQMYSKTLTQQDVDQLPVKNQFEINGTTFPDLDLDDHYPEGYSDVKEVITAIVSSEKDRSASIFQKMPKEDGF
ncbi:hypothetical protein M2480_000544 [Parabacteroides sp. PFB2-12]|uniref:hypothetical protein n=1 Tax=unclassified Parabacteroides TaxID=2649774 RepID=UPI0024737E1E|nr:MULTISPECIES: hypothetical protein [unclassified Parabacteroides]MDH6341881.1 hypothetical protein [Parabacteroides sp. PM6-13]MDH6389579.1 hypothetical protein [Parabacteroides sp. PFB2-12]